MTAQFHRGALRNAGRIMLVDAALDGRFVVEPLTARLPAAKPTTATGWMKRRWDRASS